VIDRVLAGKAPMAPDPKLQGDAVPDLMAALEAAISTDNRELVAA
jgi:hypothetical protein